MSESTGQSSNGKAQPQKPSGARKPAARKSKPLFMKQKNMMRVVYALLPILVSAIYFFGWRALAVVAVVLAAGLTTERITSKKQGRPISMACFVTCLLFGLSLPATVPYYVAIVGIVVAILFGKEVFGGFGRNFANPAIVGRAFVYVCFPPQLTKFFVPAFKGFPGGFAHWSFDSLKTLPTYLANMPETAGIAPTDAVSQASPMWIVRDVPGGEQFVDYWQLFWGNIGGVFQQEGNWRIMTAGSMGEACVPLILLAAVYLLVTKTANWRLMLSGVLGLVFANLLFRHVLGFDGPGREGVPPLMLNLLAGTTMYVLVFMLTDPVSAPKQNLAQFAYGGIIGFLVVFLRWKGVFVAAASFAILLGNIVGPWLDIGAKSWTDWRKARKKRREALDVNGSREAAGEAGL